MGLKVPIHVQVWLGSGFNESNLSVCRASRAGLWPIMYISPSLAEPDSYVYGHL
jgi:hypothetical protein